MYACPDGNVSQSLSVYAFWDSIIVLISGVKWCVANTMQAVLIIERLAVMFSFFGGVHFFGGFMRYTVSMVKEREFQSQLNHISITFKNAFLYHLDYLLDKIPTQYV